MLLACSHDALPAGMRALVLGCNRSGDIGAVSLCHLLATHVITCVWLASVHPRTGALVSLQALIAPGACEVDCTVPRGLVSRQCGLVRPRFALSVHLMHISPIWPTPSWYMHGLLFLVLRPNHSSHLSSGKPSASSWIFPVCHSYPALIAINPSVNLCVHCVITLTQDRFPYRSFGRLRLGKAAKGVAPVPCSETKCYAPTERGVAPPST